MAIVAARCSVADSAWHIPTYPTGHDDSDIGSLAKPVRVGRKNIDGSYCIKISIGINFKLCAQICAGRICIIFYITSGCPNGRTSGV